MATSNTFGFSPATGELIQSAFGRLQFRRNQISTEMMLDGQQEANFMFVEAANRGPNLWTVDLISTPLVQSVPTYTVDPTTVMMLDVNVEVSNSGSPISRNISPLTRTNYSNIPDKLQEGPPTSFWFDRLIAPTVSLWPVPDNEGPYTLKYYRYRQMQDAYLTDGQNAELPYLFLDWCVAGMAARLAPYYKPEAEGIRVAAAEKAWTIASSQNTENAPVSIAPQLNNYYR